jgi:hypothetical protein
MVKAKSQSFLLADFFSPIGKLYDFAFTILHLLGSVEEFTGFAGKNDVIAWKGITI